MGKASLSLIKISTYFMKFDTKGFSGMLITNLITIIWIFYLVA